MTKRSYERKGKYVSLWLNFRLFVSCISGAKFEPSSLVAIERRPIAEACRSVSLVGRKCTRIAERAPNAQRSDAHV